MRRAAADNARHTARFPWRAVAVGLVSVAAAIAVLVGTEARVAGEVLLLAAVVAAGRILYALRTAAAVELTATELVARPWLGRVRTVPWRSISELLHTPSPTAPRRVRVLAKERDVVLTRGLSGFDGLCDELRARAPHAAVTTSTLLRR